jgi:hypothetical protein
MGRTQARQYTESDVTAMVLARSAIEKRLNPYPDSIKELVAMVQRGSRKELGRAEIRVYRTRGSFGVFVWVRDFKDKALTAEIERWRKEQNATLIHTQNLLATVDEHAEAFRAGVRDGLAGRAPFDEQEN